MQVYDKGLTTGTAPQGLSKLEYLVDTEGQSTLGSKSASGILVQQTRDSDKNES